MTRPYTIREAAGSLVAAARSEQLGFLAAAIAYYAFVSTVPLVLLAVAAASVVGGDALAAAVVSSVEDVLTPEAANLLGNALTGDAGRGGASALGLAVLGWSGLRLFRGVDVAFASVYGTRGSESVAAQLRDALVALGAVGAAFVLLSALVAAFPLVDAPLPAPARPLLAALVLPAAFFPLYFVVPDRSVGVREALPGAVLAGLGWTALATAFSLYASHAAGFRIYGVLGGVFLALTWFYAGALLVVLGALLNAVLAGQAVDRQLQHEPRRRVGQRGHMSERDDDADGSTDGVESVETRSVEPEDLAAIRRDVEELAADLEAKTRAREDLEADLRRYVRWRQRRGHARGWGPYLVLLYGTAMTLGAFYFLSGGWAILAMVVVWLSTLGLYVLMVIVGLASAGLGIPGRVIERLRNLR